MWIVDSPPYKNQSTDLASNCIIGFLILYSKKHRQFYIDFIPRSKNSNFVIYSNILITKNYYAINLKKILLKIKEKSCISINAIQYCIELLCSYKFRSKFASTKSLSKIFGCRYGP